MSRVIYIKNPRGPSHFVTIGGHGGHTGGSNTGNGHYNLAYGSSFSSTPLALVDGNTAPAENWHPQAPYQSTANGIGVSFGNGPGVSIKPKRKRNFGGYETYNQYLMANFGSTNEQEIRWAEKKKRLLKSIAKKLRKAGLKSADASTLAAAILARKNNLNYQAPLSELETEALLSQQDAMQFYNDMLFPKYGDPYGMVGALLVLTLITPISVSISSFEAELVGAHIKGAKGVYGTIKPIPNPVTGEAMTAAQISKITATSFEGMTQKQIISTIYSILAP